MAKKSRRAQAVEQAIQRLNAVWNEKGRCESCGWHGTICDHNIMISDIEYALEENAGILCLACASKDYDSSLHKGIEIDLNPVS